MQRDFPTEWYMTALFPDPVRPRSILVICTARIGDVLLGTPVVRSLKTRWPAAQIDMLVFDGTAGALENNPDIRHVISVKRRMGLKARLASLGRMWRKYDLACSLRVSSIATIYCWAAGRKRIGVVSPSGKSWSRRWLLDRFAVERDAVTHVLESGASLMNVLGVSPSFDVVLPAIGTKPEQLTELDQLVARVAGSPFVVLHLYPKYAYKMWHIEGWVSVIRFARASGCAIVLTGGSAAPEVSYADDVVERAEGEVVNFVGKLSFGATTEVIRRARLFVGPDTSASHVAAAAGVPTVVLFGPSNPIRWGPWPKGWTGRSPWKLVGSQQRGNVYLIQGAGACVPCQREGCEGNIDSRSDCLSTLSAHSVIDAATSLLGIEVPDKTSLPVYLKVL